MCTYVFICICFMIFHRIYCFGGFGRNAARDENLFSDHGTFVEDINESTVSVRIRGKCKYFIY